MTFTSFNAYIKRNNREWRSKNPTCIVNSIIQSLDHRILFRYKVKTHKHTHTHTHTYTNTHIC
jgi:hypothetical protein